VHKCFTDAPTDVEYFSGKEATLISTDDAEPPTKTAKNVPDIQKESEVNETQEKDAVKRSLLEPEVNKTPEKETEKRSAEPKVLQSLPNANNEDNEIPNDFKCIQPVVIGNECESSQSKNVSTATIRYHYDEIQNACKRFLFKGCNGNKNNFLTIASCEFNCVKRRGSRAISNTNRFTNNAYGAEALFLQDLEELAGSVLIKRSNGDISAKKRIKRKYPLVFCSMERDAGYICTGVKRGHYLEQFYYDKEKGKCERMIYNGCGENKIL